MGVARVDAQGATMGGQLIDVERLEAVSRQNTPKRTQRKIRVVLMIDGVELVALDQPQQVWYLETKRAARRKEVAQPLDKVVEVWYLCEHVVAYDQVRAPARGRELQRQVRTKKSG